MFEFPQNNPVHVDLQQSIMMFQLHKAHELKLKILKEAVIESIIDLRLMATGLLIFRVLVPWCVRDFPLAKVQRA